MKIVFMPKIHSSLLLCAILSVSICSGCRSKEKPNSNLTNMTPTDTTGLTLTLPSPHTTGNMSLEEALASRRSRRSFNADSITAEELSQILWSAYGITKPANAPRFGGGLRTAPSAGATYPLNIYVLAGNVTGVPTGFYRFVPDGHKLIKISGKDLRSDLCIAALNQGMIKDAPASLFYSATFSRTTSVYGSRGRERYVCMDLGHSAENVYLQAEALHLGTCAIGAFDDHAVKKVMMISDDEAPLYIMPIGRYSHN